MHIFASVIQYGETSPKDEPWFACWFDSPYYPILYRHRNEEEAAEAIKAIINILQLPKGSRVLDLGCGQGRHSRTLCSLGYNVTGIDLSPTAITLAKASASSAQHFEVGDMRSFAINRQFRAVFSLFTSFGYFESDTENLRVLERIALHLEPGGILVLDYLNAIPLLDCASKRQTLEIDGVIFHTLKQREHNCIVKYIEVNDNGQVYDFCERVQLLTKNELTDLLHRAGFKVERVYGDYKLAFYDPHLSDRCLIIARKS